jgi:hypothetical protein
MKDTLWVILGVIAMLVASVAIVYGFQHHAEVACINKCAPRVAQVRGRDYLCYCETVQDDHTVLELQ